MLVIALDFSAPFLDGDLNATALVELQIIRVKLALFFSFDPPL